jgi:hypothetical protein
MKVIGRIFDILIGLVMAALAAAMFYFSLNIHYYI